MLIVRWYCLDECNLLLRQMQATREKRRRRGGKHNSTMNQREPRTAQHELNTIEQSTLQTRPSLPHGLDGAK